MGKIEHIRTMELDTSSVLIIFKVISNCTLSKMSLIFKNFEDELKITLPEEKVSIGDFIWVTNMDSDEILQVMPDNSSNTRTLILQIISQEINLSKFIRVDEKTGDITNNI